MVTHPLVLSKKQLGLSLKLEWATEIPSGHFGCSYCVRGNLTRQTWVIVPVSRRSREWSQARVIYCWRNRFLCSLAKGIWKM